MSVLKKLVSDDKVKAAGIKVAFVKGKELLNTKEFESSLIPNIITQIERATGEVIYDQVKRVDVNAGIGRSNDEVFRASILFTLDDDEFEEQVGDALIKKADKFNKAVNALFSDSALPYLAPIRPMVFVDDSYSLGVTVSWMI